MKYQIWLTESAKVDSEFFDVNEQREIVGGIVTHLEIDAELQSKRKKVLRPNPLAPWELRLGDFRVFYEVGETAMVRVIAVGRKDHNDLYIRGEKVAP